MIVLKFSGAVLFDASMITGCVDIAAGNIERAPVVVVSSMTGVSKSLRRISVAAAAGRDEDAASEVSVTVSIDTFGRIDAITRDLRAVGSVTTEREMAVVCLVGQNLWKDSTYIAEAFSALRDVPIRMISLGLSDINLSLVVPDAYFETSLVALHERFFGL